MNRMFAAASVMKATPNKANRSIQRYMTSLVTDQELPIKSEQAAVVVVAELQLWWFLVWRQAAALRISPKD